MKSPQQRPLRLLTNLDPEKCQDNPRAFHVYEIKELELPNTSNWLEVTGGEEVFRECQVTRALHHNCAFADFVVLLGAHSILVYG